jgi:hypothetical protein
MNPPPPRRWFRFSLRTMFVLVTVGCVWLGWEARVVMGRKSLRKQLEQQGVIFCPFSPTDPRYATSLPKFRFIRLLMSDVGIKTILFEMDSDADVKGYQDCEGRFPEADRVICPAEIARKYREQLELGIVPDVDIEPVVR